MPPAGGSANRAQHGAQVDVLVDGVVPVRSDDGAAEAELHVRSCRTEIGHQDVRRLLHLQHVDVGLVVVPGVGVEAELAAVEVVVQGDHELRLAAVVLLDHRQGGQDLPDEGRAVLVIEKAERHAGHGHGVHGVEAEVITALSRVAGQTAIDAFDGYSVHGGDAHFLLSRCFRWLCKKKNGTSPFAQFK